MASALACALGAVFVACSAVGRVEWGSAIALGFVLTAVPSLPDTPGQLLETVAFRAAAVLGGGLTALVGAAHTGLVACAAVIAAMMGAVVPRIGATAALAVVLIAVHSGQDSIAAPISFVLPYMIGAVVVLAASMTWFAIRRLVGRRPCRSVERLPRVPQWSLSTVAHTSRVGLAVTLAIACAALVPDDVVGGHWLVTCVVLTIQPDSTATGIRLVQRLSGNTISAILAAVILAGHPSVMVLVPATVLLFLLATALRPVNYIWWAATGPAVLLLISEYPEVFPWYEGAVRLVMNFAGATIVVLVVFGLPLTIRSIRSVARPRRE
ncbi:FUSC family protein [Nocardia rhamnosiphila]